MELFISLTKTNEGFALYSKRYWDRNLELLKTAFQEGTVPEEFHLINDLPEQNFKEELVFGDDPARISDPLMCLFADCREADSALCRMFGDVPEEVFLSVLDAFLKTKLSSLGRREATVSDYDVFYGWPKVEELDVLGGCNRTHFRIELPKDLISRYYAGSDVFGVKEYGVPRFFDLKKLSREEMLAYVIPKYYMELGMWDRKALREDSEKMNCLRKGWTETLFAALA